MRSWRGASRVGCLLSLLILTATVYFGVNVADAYLTFFRYQDRMTTEARFAAHRTDDVIKARIAAFGDSLGLPESARNVIVRRGKHEIFIYADYIVHIELPLTVQEFHFNPSASGIF